jgi:hypothetical protein
MVGPEGTDIRNAAGVRSLLQKAANRTRFLYDQLLPLNDLAALKAIGSPPDQMRRCVANYGTYIFYAASAAPVDEPWIVLPDVGSGRWYHELFDARKKTGLMAVYQVKKDDAGGTFQSTTAGPVVITDLVVSVTGAKNGDKLIIRANIPLFSANWASGYPMGGMRVTEDVGGTPVDVTINEASSKAWGNVDGVAVPGFIYTPMVVHTIANMPTEGTAQVKPLLTSVTGTGVSCSASRNAVVNVEHWRG